MLTADRRRKCAFHCRMYRPNCMQHSLSWKATGCLASQDIFEHFVDHKGSLPHSQESTTVMFPGPDESNPHFPTPFSCKVKQSRNRPGVAQRVPGDLGYQISMMFGTWRWWGRQPHAPAAFTPRKCSWYSFSLGAESTPGPWCCRQEICHWKIQWHHRESIPGPSD